MLHQRPHPPRHTRHPGEVGQARTYKGFTFLRVYNAGHMVPHDQPKAALAMMEQFISKGAFP